MTRSTLLLALIAVLPAWGVTAQQRLPLGTALEQLTAEMDRRCPAETAALESRRRELNAPSFRMSQAFHDAVCGCAPAQTRSVQEDRADPALARELTLAEVQAFVVARIMQPCIGNMFRDMFSGALCRDLFPEPTCTCMGPEVQGYTDAEAMEIGASFPAYRQAEERARNEGTAPPPRSPLLARVLASVEKCSGR